MSIIPDHFPSAFPHPVRVAQSQSDLLRHSRLPDSLMLLALLQTLVHWSFKNPPCFINELMQFLEEALALRCVVFLLVLLLVECSTDFPKGLDNFFAQLIGGLLDELRCILLHPLGDRRKRSFETGDVSFEVGVANSSEHLA